MIATCEEKVEKSFVAFPYGNVIEPKSEPFDKSQIYILIFSYTETSRDENEGRELKVRQTADKIILSVFLRNYNRKNW
jgi:hypothetical protein